MATIDDVLAQRLAALAQQVKVPSAHDRVYKDECMFSFASPESEGGMFVNMTTLQGFGKKFVALDHERSGNALYYNEVHHRVPLSEEEMTKQEAVPESLAIGTDTGFNAKRSYKVEKMSSVVLFPEQISIALPNDQVPERILAAVAGIQANDGSGVQDQVATWEEQRRESKYARTLVQKEPWRKISPVPSDWKCDETGVTENLWLNLSTGHIGSGRQHWDGSGGNGAALRHFQDTGKAFPLVVKLGTITPFGADVYSYAEDEDDLVLDPLLKEHLEHWGINMMEMEKTEKTMAELQIDMNMKFAFDRITEGGSALTPVQGPHLVGLTNLGNFCYMSSVLQALWGVPALSDLYVRNVDLIRRTAPSDVANDFLAQFAKLGQAIVTGETDKTLPDVSLDAVEAKVEQNAVAPRLFKALVGRNHAEFSSGHQQDACHYFIHLIEVMERAERASAGRVAAADAPPTSALVTFELEYRTQCSVSGAVSYKRNATAVLGLDIPLEAAVNQLDVTSYREREQKRQKLREERAEAYIGAGGSVSNDEDEAPVIPRVPYEACVAKFAAEEVIADVFSPAIGAKANASRTTRIASFPPYLMVQLRRYYVDEQWRPRKMDVLTAMPETLDLEGLRARGPLPDEKLQPETSQAESAQAPPQPTADAAIVSQLTSAGFSENACARAALAVKNANAEAAMNWLLSHLEDSDINDPLPKASPSAQGPQTVDPASVEMLCGMGFTARQANAALKSCANNLERAADWLFSRMDNLDSAVAEVEGQPSTAPTVKKAMLDGQGKYELVAIISHIGSNTACGHYVAHVKKRGKWYIFNDEKVAESAQLPLELGYMYLYCRTDAAWT